MSRESLRARVGKRFTPERAKATRASISGASQYIKFEKNSTNLIRILPPLIIKHEDGTETEEDDWSVTVWKHFIKNYRGTGKPLVFTCPAKMGGGRCPACEERERLLKSPSAADRELADEEYKPSAKAVCRAVDRQNEAAGPQMCELSPSVVKELCGLTSNTIKYGKDFTDLFEGDDIVIERTDAGRTTYATSIAIVDVRPQLAETEEQMEQWLDAAERLDLVKAAEVMTFEQLVDKEKWIVKNYLGNGGRKNALGPSLFDAGKKALAAAARPSALASDTVAGNIDSGDGLDDDSDF